MEPILTSAPATVSPAAPAPPDPSLRLVGVPAPLAAAAGAPLAAAPRGRRWRRGLTVLVLAVLAAAAIYASGLAAAGPASGHAGAGVAMSAGEASASVLRVGGPSCDAVIAGTGWVAAADIVVTAAHVVAGVERPTVTAPGGAELPATPVHFDSRNDLALLRVDGLETPALELAQDPEPGSAARTLGFPEQRPFTASRTRLGETETMLAPDVYGRGPLSREMVRFEGSVRHGNSGGPVVDRAGRVLTTVLGTSTGERASHSMGAPNELVFAALATAGGAVSTGPCMPTA